MSRYFSRRQFVTIGTAPLRMKGRGDTVSYEVLSTETFSQEKMKLHCIQGYISTLYLAEYPERREWLLLDTGMPTDFARVQSYIAHVDSSHQSASQSSSAGLGSSLCERLKLVVSSHCHIDHIGAGFQFGRAGVPVVAAKGFERYYAHYGGLAQELIDIFLSMLVARRLGRRYESPFSSLYQRDLNTDRTKFPLLDDGQSLPMFEDWVALKCPGHTGHMILMYHPLTQILYAADFVVAPRAMQFKAPMPVEIDWAYNHSLHRLRKLPVRFLLLAHGGVVNVEELAGGWEGVLDDVVQNQTKKSSRPMFRLIEQLVGFSTEPKDFLPSELPRGPLPATWDNPPPVFHLR